MDKKRDAHGRYIGHWRCKICGDILANDAELSVICDIGVCVCRKRTCYDEWYRQFIGAVLDELEI